jgi:soluble lytic murein transglycosylase-like protein
VSIEAAIERVGQIRALLTAPRQPASTAAPAAGAPFTQALLSALDTDPSADPSTGSAPVPAYGTTAAVFGAASPPAYPTASATSFGAAPAATSCAPTYDGEIQAAAAREGVDPALVRAVISHESGFDPNATSPAGAQGLMQLMPSTAAGLGVTNPYDPAQSIAGGTHLLRTLLDRYHGDLGSAVAAYNAGAGAVDRYGGVPPYAETQAYVRNVLATYQSSTSERNTA